MDLTARVPPPPKRVWIVGAGFSRSLGAPLLNDLLSPAARMAIESHYPSLPKAVTEPVFWLYHYGTDFAEGTLESIGITRGVRKWRDAEHFLETLDLACESKALFNEISALYSRLRSISSGVLSQFELPPIDEFRENAKRVVAAICAAFVEGMTEEVALKRERWGPYQRWLKRLRASRPGSDRRVFYGVQPQYLIRFAPTARGSNRSVPLTRTTWSSPR